MKDIHGQNGRSLENGMTFRIIATGKSGARCVNLSDNTVWNIPKEVLRKACEAGYATTIHRSQGMTVDRCAALFPSDSELGVQSAVRGRHARQGGKPFPVRMQAGG